MISARLMRVHLRTLLKSLEILRDAQFCGDFPSTFEEHLRDNTSASHHTEHKKIEEEIQIHTVFTFECTEKKKKSCFLLNFSPKLFYT